MVNSLNLAVKYWASVPKVSAPLLYQLQFDLNCLHENVMSFLVGLTTRGDWQRIGNQRISHNFVRLFKLPQPLVQREECSN
jgi:hypothetical protein